MAIQQRTGEAKVKGVADVVFLFDCTGSMSPYIENVKDNVASLIKGFNATPNVKLDWRVRAMGFKDFYVDKDYLIDRFTFTSDADEFANSQLARLEADGGGDEKESCLDAIWYAIKQSEWRPRCNKVVVVFTDAGTKGLHERTLNELGVVDELSYLQQEIMKNKIQLFMYCKTDPLYEQLHQLERSHVYQYDNPGEELLKTDFADLLEVIGKTVSASIVTDNRTL